ncbi:hypothetical protein vseg_006639 [Gypsophila vaccaria]
MGEIYEAKWLKNTTKWTKEENKRFERALAIYDDATPNRWYKVAEMIPGKTVGDVMRQYEELIEDVTDIEAGLVPIPGYLSSPFTLEWVGVGGFGCGGRFGEFRKRGGGCGVGEVDRKKGVPWTEDEHRRFLLGLQKHGKGDWRNISRNFVISKTPTQVASHAQKYFLRQNSGGKDKRRPSIHDITTANISNSSPGVSDSDQKPKLPLDQSGPFTSLQKSINVMPKMLMDWSNSEAFMVFNTRERHNQYSAAYQGAYVGSS